MPQKITMVGIVKATISRVGSEDGRGGLREVFERANKAWPWVSQSDPERLCKLCVNAMLEVSCWSLVRTDGTNSPVKGLDL